MANILIIKAHPASWGFTHKIADRYKEEKEKQGHNAKIIDLYKDENYKQDFLRFEDIRPEWSGEEVRQRVHADIKWADETVLIYSVW